MKKMLYLIIISLAFFITSANAEETTTEEYTIKKGDTLWDISKSKLQDPFLWPKLWKENPEIKNPDLIYPGDKLRIPSKEIITPMVKAPILEEIPVVPEPKIIQEKPTVTSPPLVEVPKEMPKQYIVDKKLYIASGWISDKFPSIGEIINAPSDRTIFGSADLVYLKTTGSIAVGDKFFALRDVKEVKHPETGKSLGHQIRITGILEIVGMDNNIPRAKITTAFEDLQTGDGLMPYAELEPPLAPDTLRTPDIQGYIVESYTNSLMVSRGDIVYLDKGQNDGLKVGNIFSTLSKTPVERSIGRIQVISLQPTTSAAIVLKSDKEITIGDMWGNR